MSIHIICTLSLWFICLQVWCMCVCACVYGWVYAGHSIFFLGWPLIVPGAHQFARVPVKWHLKICLSVLYSFSSGVPRICCLFQIAWGRWGFKLSLHACSASMLPNWAISLDPWYFNKLCYSFFIILCKSFPQRGLVPLLFRHQLPFLGLHDWFHIYASYFIGSLWWDCD